MSDETSPSQHTVHGMRSPGSATSNQALHLLGASQQLFAVGATVLPLQEAASSSMSGASSPPGSPGYDYRRDPNLFPTDPRLHRQASVQQQATSSGLPLGVAVGSAQAGSLAAMAGLGASVAHPGVMRQAPSSQGSQGPIAALRGQLHPHAPLQPDRQHDWRNRLQPVHQAGSSGRHSSSASDEAIRDRSRRPSHSGSHRQDRECHARHSSGSRSRNSHERTGHHRLHQAGVYGSSAHSRRQDRQSWSNG